MRIYALAIAAAAALFFPFLRPLRVLSRSIQGDPAKSIICRCSLHNLDAPFQSGFSLP
jgi:hypothetical protein